METTRHEVISLWPGGAPGSAAWDQVEEETQVSGGPVMVRNVTQPSLTVYPAAQPNGTAVIVAPGGAWHVLMMDYEGTQVAEWLNARGVTAFVLKYRLFRTGPDPDREVMDYISGRTPKVDETRALMALTQADAQQAVRIVRQQAAEWGVNPERIGFMGFSAGGGVTTQVALNYTPDCRPNFAAPIYAAVFEEVQAPADAPPLFLACTQSDEMASRASLILYKAWKDAKRPVEMHIYAHGDHGFGMRTLGLPSDTWIERFAEWLKALGMM